MKNISIATFLKSKVLLSLGLLIVLFLAVGIWRHIAQRDLDHLQSSNEKFPAVGVDECQVRDLKKVFRSFGTILPWKEVVLRPPVQSIVREINHSVGDSIAENEVILKSNSEVQNLRAELEKVDFELKNLDFSVTMALAKKKFLSSKEVKQKELEHRANVLRSKLLKIENAGVLRSPIAGVISDLEFKVGDYLDSNTNSIVRVVDTSRLKVPVYVPQSVVQFIKKGSSVDIFREGVSNAVLGNIATIAPSVDVKTGSVFVEIVISSPPQGLLPGMYVELEIPTQVKTEVKSVPLAAIVREGDKTFVYRLDSKFERTPASEDDLREIAKVLKVPVTIGLQQGDLVQIENGLEELDQVVSRGVGGLSDGTVVEVIR